MTKRVTSYLDEFQNSTKLQVVDLPFLGSKVSQQLLCTICGNIFQSTPNSRFQSYKKHGTIGCTVCNASKQREITMSSRQANLDKMDSMGLKVLSPDYDGRYVYEGTPDGKIQVLNVHTQEVSRITPTNILARGVTQSRDRDPVI